MRADSVQNWGAQIMLNIKKEKDGEKLKIALEGRLDTSSAPQLEKELETLEGDVKELVFDIKYLDYVSSAGLRILLSAHKNMSRQGSMVLRGANEIVMEIFEVTGFAGILNIEA